MRMEYTPQQLIVKSKLEAWRLKAIDALGYSPQDINYCCRFNLMHDIFVDRIVNAVPFIRCYEDFYNVAYYWHLLDERGQEVYYLICDDLNIKKRSCGEDYSSSNYHQSTVYQPDKRLRTETFY